MKHRTDPDPTFLLKIAPIPLVLTGGAVIWTLFVGVTPPLSALLFNCMLGVVSFFLGYQHSRRESDPWLSSLLSLLTMVVFIVGVLVAREALYGSQRMAVSVQILAMVWFVFFGLLLSMKGRIQNQRPG